MIKSLRIVASLLSLAFAVSPVVLLAAASGAPAESPASTAVYTAAETAPFKTLIEATLAALDAGKNTEMVAKLTDLETAWDDKEAVLKPRNPDVWTKIDKTLDKAISALRSSRVDLPKGKSALKNLLVELATATKA
jgi:hypothetical protein